MARILTYPTKFKNLSSVSPVLYSDQNTEVNQIYQDLNDLDAGVALKGGESSQNFLTNNLGVSGDLSISGALTLKGKGLMIPGYINGGLAFQSASTPPTVKGGSVFEYKGLYFPVGATDINLSSGDSFLASNQSFDTYLWYNTIMNDAGAFKWVPAFDITSPLATGLTVTNVSVSGTTFTINMPSTAGLVAGNILVLKDNNGASRTCDGVFKIVSVSSGVSATVTGKAVGNGTYSGGTVDSYYPIYTLHGGVGGVSSASGLDKYTPSQVFCPAGNFYGLDKYGVPTSVYADVVYRVICPFYNGATSTSISHVISYKSGNDKNDLRIESNATFSAVYVGTKLSKTIPTDFNYLWGDAITVTNPSGLRFTANKIIPKLYASIVHNPVGTSSRFAVYKTGVEQWFEIVTVGNYADMSDIVYMAAGDYIDFDDLGSTNSCAYIKIREVN